MKKKLIFVALLVSVAGSGCGGKAITVSLSPNQGKYQTRTYAIFPFSDSRATEIKEKNPDSPRIMTDAFETAFLNTGYSLVERNLINNVMKEIEFSYQGNVDEAQLKEFGKMTNSDVIILGLLRAFQPAQYRNPLKPEKVTQCTSISFSIKAIHIQSGEILWKGSLTKSTDFTNEPLLSCEYDVLRYADKVASDIVTEIMKSNSRPQGNTQVSNSGSNNQETKQ